MRKRILTLIVGLVALGTMVPAGTPASAWHGPDGWTECWTQSYDLPGAWWGCLGTIDSQTIYGTNKADNIIALAGNDIVFGYASSDRLFGDEGADTLKGGDGTGDYCDGGPGQDTSTGCETKVNIP